MSKRSYKVDKSYQSISIRFNIKDKEEKKLLVFLNSMSSEDRTTFILELYQKKGNIQNQSERSNEMSVYEKRLFEIVEKAVSVQSGGSQSKNLINTDIQTETIKKSNAGLKSNVVDYSNLNLGSKKKEEVSLEEKLDSFAENGMRD